MSRSFTTLFSGSVPSRVVCAILAIISVAFVSILRYEHDQENLKIPMALTVVSLALFLVAAGMSIYVWYLNISFCPRRAASMFIGGLVAVGCCIGTVVVVWLADPVDGAGRTLQNSLTGMQISAAVLEIVNIAVLAYEWHCQTNRVPQAKQYVGMTV